MIKSAVVTEIAHEGRFWRVQIDRQVIGVRLWLESEPDLKVDDEVSVTIEKVGRQEGWTAEWVKPEARGRHLEPDNWPNEL